jgi:threonine synthase
MKVVCDTCNIQADLIPQQFCCDCGGAFEFIARDDFDPISILDSDYSVWRYRHLLPLDFSEPRVCLGMGWTPLVRLDLNGREVLLKLDFLSPTGCYKDRGTTVVINILSHAGVKTIVDDSSGNAGASVSAYANAAGMRADIFVPAHASAAKKSQIAMYGATVHPVAGPRAKTTEAALNAIDGERVYASHAYHPGFLLGQQTAAWELWEQLGGRPPDWMIIPLAQGGNLLGYWFGFRRLLWAGVIDQMPRLVAVQSDQVAPLARAYERGLDDVPPVSPGKTIAEGIAVSNPIRGKRLLQAIRETEGLVVEVSDPDVLDAQGRLARHGIWVEPTSATVLAAYRKLEAQIDPSDSVMLALTGSGLKSPATFDELS